MLAPVFTIQLNHKIIPGTVTTGKFDGKHSCLVSATVGGKILIHSPHGLGSSISQNASTEINFLNINQKITCTACGKLDENSDKDLLFIGTHSSLMAYDVFNNSDLFFKDTPDGCNAVAVGKLGNIKDQLVIVGGNCSIIGFDKKGDDQFWTVTGDNVCSLCLLDYNNDGQNELLVGSEDFDIRVFKEDEIIAEMTETDIITCVKPIDCSSFGYALANGTVGAYDKAQRCWRFKSRNQITSILAFDANADGKKELVVGWNNGKIDVRNGETGEVIFKDNLSNGVAGIVQADYGPDGKTLLLVLTIDGELRGYSCLSPTEAALQIVDTSIEQEVIRELCQKKQRLLLELKNFEENRKTAALMKVGDVQNVDHQKASIIPANTQFKTILKVAEPESATPYLQLTASTSNDTVIRAMLIFAEGLFENGECYVLHPLDGNLSKDISVPLSPLKNNIIDLHVKAFIGNPTSKQFHVFELTRTIPRFAMYWPSPTALPLPESSVSFKVQERAQRMVLWFNNNFLEQLDLNTSSLKIHLKPVRPNEGPCVIEMTAQGQVTVRTDCIELAGDLVQSICGYFNVDHLSSVAHFPIDFERARTTINAVAELDAVRQRMSADMADVSNLVKGLVVKAEDARILGDMKTLRRSYTELFNCNRDLIAQYHIRSNNHNELMKSLKEINQSIQRASRLRVGKAQTETVSKCRIALKDKDSTAFVKILEVGGC